MNPYLRPPVYLHMASLSDRPRRAPLDLSHHFSRSVKSRQQSSIKDFYKFFAIPGIGNLAGGVSPATLAVCSPS